MRRADLAPATEYGYAHDWRCFVTWCERANLQPLPADSETLSLFVADQLDQGKRVTTVSRYIAGICYQHRQMGFPKPADCQVRKTIRGARRLRAEQPRQMRPITVAQLRQVAAHLGKENTAIATRDQAVMVFGFASGLRRSNLASLNLEDLSFCPEGVMVLIRREKQDRDGRGRLLTVPFGHNSTCPIRALESWIKIRGEFPGPLFTRLDIASSPLGRLSVNAIWKIVKRAIAGIGLDPRFYGPHSLRAGLITEAGIAGVNHLTIALASGHKSLDSLKRYFRPQNFKACAASFVGL